MNKISAYMHNPLIRRSILTVLIVVGVCLVRIPKEVEANACGTVLNSCPASIVVWGNVTANFVKYGTGTLPNGHAFCAYSGYNGDPFMGVFDRVENHQVTFARKMSCTTTGYGGYDQNGNPTPNGCYGYVDCGDGGSCFSYTCTQSCTRVVGQYIEMSNISQGTKCQNTSAPSDTEVGLTDGIYWLNHDCYQSGNSEGSGWRGWQGYDPGSSTGVICYSSDPNNPQCAAWSVGQAPTSNGTQWCVNVAFQ